MTTDTQVSRAEATGMLARIKELDGYIREMEEEREALRSAVRSVLEEDNDPLIDGEHGWVATLKEKNKPATVDVISFAKKPEHAGFVVEAAAMGLLNAALTPLRAQKGRSAAADALLRYEMPGGAVHELRIERAD